MRIRNVFMAALLTVLLLPVLATAQLSKPVFSLQSAATADGNGTPMSVAGWPTVGLQVIIGNTATVTIQATVDGDNWKAHACILSTDGTLTSSTEESAILQCQVGGYASIRAVISSCSSCTVTVKGILTTASIRGGGGGGAVLVGLDDAFANDPTISPTSESAPLKIRGTGAQSTSGWNIYQHSDGTPTIKCVVSDVEGACNVSVDLNAAKSFIIKDAGAAVLTITPDNAGNLKYVWASGYRPIKTLSLPADALYPRGSSTLVTGTALITSGLISPYITITDSDNDGFYRYLVMDPKWDGGTVTATVTVVNTNATPANNFEVDVSGECYPAGTAVTTTISATGEQAANVEFDASGACGGSACSQFDPASATTAAITINGTPAGGNFCAFQGQVDATATTETVTGIKVVQLDIHYGISQGF